VPKTLSTSQQIAQLNRELAVAQICYEMYKNLTFTSSGISNNIETLYFRYPNLIKAERNIYFSTLIIQLYKLIDDHPKSISLEKLIGMCNTNSSYTTIKTSYQQLISRYSKPIRLLRSKACAHTDIYDEPDELFNQIAPPIAYQDLNDALIELKTIINFINSCLNGGKINNPPIDFAVVGKEQKEIVQLIANHLNK